MEYQAHFLGRLDRVELPHAELALTLYQQESLVAYFLHQAKLPEGVDRVAISLDHPENGPFLIVTRDGKFITCLAPGMKVNDLPILTRGQLDSCIAKTTDMRNRLQAAYTLAGPKGQVAKLLDRIFTAGPELSREEFVGISGFQPLMSFQLFRLFIGTAVKLEDLRNQLIKVERAKPALKPYLRRYWDTFWAIGHLAILAFLDGRALVDALPPQIDLSETPLSWGAVRQGIISLALRGTWAVAKVGKAQLRTCKEAFDDAPTQTRLMTSATALLGLGVRHSKLQSEVRKALLTPNENLQRYYPPAVLKLIQETAKAGLDEPESLHAIQRQLGQRMVMAFTENQPKGATYAFEREQDVPDDLAMSVAINLHRTYIDDPTGMLLLMAMVPWVARAEPEQFFLPQAFLRAIRHRWSPDDTLHLLEPLRKHYHAKAAPDKPSGPSRQGPCPCGSGKKYKRCCGKSTS